MAADNTPGVKTLRKVQFGKESTAAYGTKVKASAVWRGEGTIKNDQLVVNPVEDIGIAIDTDRAYIPSKGGTLNLESTPATFEQLPYPLAMGIKNVTSGTSDSTGSGYVYTFPLPTTAKNEIATYSIEGGDDREVEFGQYAFCESLKLSGKYREAVMMSAMIKCRTTEPVNFTGATVSFSTSTAGTIVDSASGFAIFPSTTFAVKVRNSSSNDGTYSMATGSTNTLTLTTGTFVLESSGSTVTITQTFTPSIAVPTVEEILFNKAKLYIDDVGGTIGTTQKSNTFLSFDLDLNTGWKGQATGDGRLDFSFAKYTKAEWTLKVTFEHDGTATAEKAKWIAKTPRLIRIKIEGSAFAVAGSVYTYKTLIIDVPGVWTDFSALENDDGNDTCTGTLRGGYDVTAALGGRIVVVNSLSALT
jgi:hypothetical protein